MNTVNHEQAGAPRYQSYCQAEADTPGIILGKRMIVTGFIICILGLLMYCTIALSAETAGGEPRFIGESLAVVGAGVILWLAGAVRYITAACDDDYTDELF